MGRIIQLTMDNPEKIKIGFQLEVIGIDGNQVSLELKETKGSTKKRSLSENLAGYSGGMFKTADEVDEFLKTERESWDK